MVPAAPVNPENPDCICEEGCTGENCDCPCHQKGLYDRVMACETLEEIFAILDEATDEELDALTDEEWDAIDEYMKSLEPEPLPAVVIESEPPVVSEIVVGTVSFDEVAPLGAPVVGGAE